MSFADACRDNQRKAHGLKHAKQASPAKTACPGCKFNPANIKEGDTETKPCSWPNQSKDITPGVTIGMHAHTATSRQAVSPSSKKACDYFVADESMLPSLMPSDGITWPFKRHGTLFAPSSLFGASSASSGMFGTRRKAVKRKRDDGTKRSASELLNAPGKELYFETADLIDNRIALAEALKLAAVHEHGFVMADTVATFLESSAEFVGDIETPKWKLAMETEEAHAATLGNLLSNVMVAHAETGFNIRKLLSELKRSPELLKQWRERLNSPNLSAREFADILKEAATGDIAEAIDLSRFLATCYKAIGIHARQKRDRVYGLNVLTKAGSTFVRCQLLTPVPPEMAARHGVFLDGTSNELLATAYAGRYSPKPKFVFLKEALESGPYWLNQYATLGSDSMFAGDDPQSNLDTLWRFIQFEVVEARQRGTQAPVVILELTNPDDDKSAPVLRQKHMLLICTKLVAGKLRKLGLPDDVGVLTYGSLRGINAYEKIRTLVQVGRPHPAPWDVEMMAEGTFADVDDCREITRSPAGDRHTVKEYVTDQRGVTKQVLRERHPNKWVEAIRYTISDAEVIQGFMRMRPAERTAETAFVAHVFSTVELPLQPNQWLMWADAERPALSFMHQAGMVVGAPEEIAKLVPGCADLGERRLKDIAAVAKQAHAASQNVSQECFTKQCSAPVNSRSAEDGVSLYRGAALFLPWQTVRYRPAGSRGPARTASYDTARFPTEADALAELARLNGKHVKAVGGMTIEVEPMKLPTVPYIGSDAAPEPVQAVPAPQTVCPTPEAPQGCSACPRAATCPAAIGATTSSG